MFPLAVRISAQAATLVAALATSSSVEAPHPLGGFGPPVAVPLDSARPGRALDAEEQELWRRGRELFHRAWGEDEGLGTPAFNAVSCAHCHNDPGLGGAGANDVNVLALQGSQTYYAPPQVKVRPLGLEGDVQAQLRAVRHGGRLPEGVSMERIVERQTPSLYGLALIDSISDEEIRRNHLYQHQRARGERRPGHRASHMGRISMSRIDGRLETGRFGWRAQLPHLDDFVCMALAGELGLTAPDQGRSFGLHEDEDGAPDPELTQTDFDALVFFVRELGAPAPASAEGEDDVDPARIARGKELFSSVGCANCHVPALQGTHGPVRLYSDLLLHRVLRERPGQGRAAWFRTPPLWGVAETAPYLHDGRAKTLRDAILLHAGEAAAMRGRFYVLPREDQDALVAFVASLPLPRPEEAAAK